MNGELTTRPTSEVVDQAFGMTSPETKMNSGLETRATGEAKIETDQAEAGIHFEVAGRSEVKNEARELHPVKKEDEKQVKDVEQAESNFVVGNTQKNVVVDAPEKLSVTQVREYEVIQQITNQLKPRIKTGETSMRLTLKPDKLGSIEVEMVSSAQGVSVSFVTEQASTGQLLEAQVNQLKQSLKDAGVQLNNLNINQHNQPRHEGGAFRQEQPSVPFHSQEIQDGTPPEDNTQAERVVSPHEVDYLI
jgi:flagellar hook-length control protein FliK